MSTSATGPEGQPGEQEPHQQQPPTRTPYQQQPYAQRPYQQQAPIQDPSAQGQYPQQQYPQGDVGRAGSGQSPYPQSPYSQSPPAQGGYQQGGYPQGGYPQGPFGQPYAPQKSRVIAGVLGILLGSLGIHRFYLGYTTIGVVQILLSTVGAIFTFGLSAIAAGIWGLVEGIMILVGSEQFRKDAQGIPLKD